MTLHLMREINKLKKSIVLLGGEVEIMVEKALKSCQLRNKELAEEVKKYDDRIDSKEVEIEEECLKILALYQPVAIDLRFIVAILKINSDIERVGDEACNIASRALKICSLPQARLDPDFNELAERVIRIFKDSIDALVNLNQNLAENILERDDEVDTLVKKLFSGILEEIKDSPDDLEALVEYMRIFRHLERIADHSTNIAEDVIYMLKGEIMRHKH